TGTSYSTSVGFGTSGTNYLRTTTSYDSRGRADRTVDPDGTISRTVYDSLGRVASEWIGSDDTPNSGNWSPSNTAGTNLVDVRDYTYDGGSVGDSNLTSLIEHPGHSQPDMRTDSVYDWRDRLVAQKSGVATSESTSDTVNRPLTLWTYDNLDQVVQEDVYD